VRTAGAGNRQHGFAGQIRSNKNKRSEKKQHRTTLPLRRRRGRMTSLVFLLLIVVTASGAHAHHEEEAAAAPCGDPAATTAPGLPPTTPGRGGWAENEGGGEALTGPRRGFTLVHFSAQRKRFLRARGCVQGLFRGCHAALGVVRGCLGWTVAAETAEVEQRSGRV
jgi:hypothetical protein